MAVASESKRFYVGNLSSDITEAELRSLFERFGAVVGVDVKNKRDIDGNVIASFAFVKVDNLSDVDVTNVIKHCNHLKWKKQIIRVQLAQESFMERLQKERESNKRQVSDFHPKQASAFANASPEGFKAKPKPANDSGYDPMALVKGRVALSGSEENKTGSGPVSRRRYYSSSDDDGDEGQLSTDRTGAGVSRNSGEKFLSKLESFNSDFWKDSETKEKRKSSDSMTKRPTKFQDSTFDGQKTFPRSGLGPNQSDRKRAAKFEESKPDSSTDMNKKKKFLDDDGLEEGAEDERIRNLKILAGIVGGPSKEDDNYQTQVEKSPQKPSNEDKYWVSSSLTQALSGVKKTENEPASGKAFSFGFSGSQNWSSSSSGFSLLSKFGKSNDIEADDGKSFSKRHSADSRNPFKQDWSDDEDDGKSSSGKGLMDLDPVDLFAQKLKERASATKGASESFFFARFDPRFDEGRRFFIPNQSVDEMRTKHDENRPALAEIMRKKLKRRAKKQEKLSFDLKRTNKKGGIFKKKFAHGKKFNKK